MGLRLCFQNDEMMAVKATTGKLCDLCLERQATWEAEPKELGAKIQACAHCAMYSTKTAWGHKNREELLHVGRYCQVHALKHKKPPPDIDERGRLEPAEAEKYMLGVAYSTLLFSKLGRFGKGRGLDSMSD